MHALKIFVIANWLSAGLPAVHIFARLTGYSIEPLNCAPLLVIIGSGALAGSLGMIAYYLRSVTLTAGAAFQFAGTILLLFPETIPFSGSLVAAQYGSLAFALFRGILTPRIPVARITGTVIIIWMLIGISRWLIAVTTDNTGIEPALRISWILTLCFQITALILLTRGFWRYIPSANSI